MDEAGSISRRRFLGAAAIGTSALAAPAIGAATVAAKPTKPYKVKNLVDLHAHYISPQYRAALAAQGINTIGGIPIPQWSPAAAVEFMDRWQIALQMLSVSDPGVAFMPDSDAAALARDCNEYVADVITEYTERFGGFAVVPLHDVSESVAEVDYALDTLGLDGVGLLSSHEGRYLGDPAFDALLSNLNDRGAWVMVHPTAVSADDKPAYQIPEFVAEYPFDTTRTIISLIFNGVFERYPDIRWQFAHGGGTVPMLRFRLDALAKAVEDGLGPLLGLPAGSQGLSAKSATDALKAASFDTALVPEVPALRAVRGMTGIEGVYFGSDWPFAGRLYLDDRADPQPALSRAFDKAERRQVDRLNARREFPRLSR